jgi:hypothetical protein
MKLYKFIFLTILLTVSAISTFAQSKTDTFGYYTIEKSTKDFSDISEIHLAGEYGANEKPPMYGLIRMKARKAKDYVLNKPVSDGKKITFTTRAVNGISYSFSGTFVRLGNFPEERPEGEVLLKGTLTKMKGKTKLASGTFSFSYSAGD